MGSLIKRMLAPVLTRLGSRAIVTIGGVLFVLNMLIPDPIPLIDEILILAGTVLFSRWAKTGSTGAMDAEEAVGAGGGVRAPKHVGRGSTQR
jgi:hypothetical protein